MRRRKAVKAIALSAVTPQLIFGRRKNGQSAPVVAPQPSSFESRWREWPDMLWAGPEFWGNRLQDWKISNGRALCVVSERNRTLHCLTAVLSDELEPFETSVTVEWMNEDVGRSSTSQAGFLLGAKGRFNDYRSAAVFGEGLRAGITGGGDLFIGDLRAGKKIPAQGILTLLLKAVPQGRSYHLRIAAVTSGGEVAGEFEVRNISPEKLTGNIALVSHVVPGNETGVMSSVAFGDWKMNGPKVIHHPDRTFGPICFVQYTLHNNILKLTAQLTPVDSIPGRKVSLQVKEGNTWKTLKEGDVRSRSRTSPFRVESWPYREAVPYRIRLELPLKNGVSDFFYEGEIAREPMDARRVKMAVFSCNCDYGFPDADVPMHVSTHKPDLAVFLGDQFYESTGGFGVDRGRNADLDYLRKWYMFGWSYRDIFRRIPSITIPDDHDVYHGNVWGEGGKQAPTDKGWGYEAQDQGGYKMPAEWVNMVQDCQTSHLPDPYDPTPVTQGIGVYYTGWNYAGISMAILEDRKFKSAPKNVLPAEAKVVNGFIQNPDFRIRDHYDINAQLLGERQLSFLEHWTADWHNAEMKVVLSQTNFCAVATLPKGSIIDEIVPRLPIPEAGEYPEGDAPTTDMDSNGWPQKGRDQALRVIRKAFAFHIAGDQHLASVVRYGIDEFGDAGYAFAGPALNNLWPRRWWPSVQAHESLPGQPPYTGNFEDGFGNRMTVCAVANPRKTGHEPALIHDRATGYGIVTFDKEERTITIACWPRYADPEKDVNGQFPGWPITISQQDNYGRRARAELPALQIVGASDPVVQVINESTSEVIYTLRIKGVRFKPKVFDSSRYSIRVTDTTGGKEKLLRGVRVATRADETIRVEL